MTIRNFWSLECGEVLTAETISNYFKKIPDVEIYFPLHDVGIDLLVVRGKHHVSIQVKESRYYKIRDLKGSKGHSWHQVARKKFLRGLNKIDFYVFLTYIPKIREHKLSSFDKKFLVVPTSKLANLIRDKPFGKKEIYSFYFNFGDDKIIEKRNELTDYSEYLDRWEFIEEKLRE